MSQTKIQLKYSSFLNIPFHTYERDFLFSVNGREFRTSRVISDVLSPVISQIHSTDPTVDNFTINTAQQGDFSYILNLISCNEIEIPEQQIPFIIEVIQILGNEHIVSNLHDQNAEITNNNVFSLLQNHEQYPIFFSTQLSNEINYFSSHFYELCENHEDFFLNLNLDTLMKIVSNDQIRLNSEDQLLQFINNLYRHDQKYLILYELVQFVNISSECIREFLATFDLDDMTMQTWIQISKRLEAEIKENNFIEEINNRYIPQELHTNEGTVFQYSPQNEFNGIINHLHQNSNGIIENNIIISAKHFYSKEYHPHNVVLFENKEKFFHSEDKPDNWICFDFKDKRVIPSHYSIRSHLHGSVNSQHPKSWVIEGSNDSTTWKLLAEENDCPYLNGNGYSHTFPINHHNSNVFKFIRMRLTGPSWSGHNYLRLEAFEIYGRLIETE